MAIWASEKEPFEGWVILEILGHRRLGGYVREVELAGAGFLRIDVPGADGETAATQFYPPSAVYCITPTTEETAKALARRSQPQPVQRWELPPTPEERRRFEEDDEGERDEFSDPFSSE